MSKPRKARLRQPAPANLCGGYTIASVLLAHAPPRMHFAYEGDTITATLDRHMKCVFISRVTAWSEPPIRVMARLLFCAPFALEYWKTHA